MRMRISPMFIPWEPSEDPHLRSSPLLREAQPWYSCGQRNQDHQRGHPQPHSVLPIWAFIIGVSQGNTLPVLAPVHRYSHDGVVRTNVGAVQSRLRLLAVLSPPTRLPNPLKQGTSTPHVRARPRPIFLDGRGCESCNPQQVNGR